MIKPRIVVLASVLLASGLHGQAADSRLPNATWGVSVGVNGAPVLGMAASGFAANQFYAMGMPVRATVALDVLLSQDSQSPYYITENLNGTRERACVDSRYDQRADDTRCAPDVGAAGRAELMSVLSSRWGVGAGARVGTAWAVDPYGLVRYEQPLRAGLSSWFGQLSVGDGFSQLDAGVAIRF